MDRSDWGNDEGEPVRPPLPQEDRIWRHPSELHRGAASAPAPVDASRSRRPLVVAAVAAGLLVVGATGASVRYITNSAPTLAAGTLDTAVSVVSTSVPPDDDPVPGTGVTLVASVAGGERRSRAVAVDDATLVTTMGAVAGSTALAVILLDGRRLEASLLGLDKAAGVAVVAVAAGGIAPDATGSAVPIVTGTQLWMAGEDEPGRVTGTGRHTTAPDGTRLNHMLRLDVEEMKAREGQALVDRTGTVVALCTRDAKGDVVGIPIDLATSAAHSLRAHQRLVLPWIGVTGRDAAPDEDAGWPHGGAMLTGVKSGGPADAAGLEAGDVVVSLGGTKVASISALVLAARAHDAGDAVDIAFVRDDEAQTLSLTLGELP